MSATGRTAVAPPLSAEEGFAARVVREDPSAAPHTSHRDLERRHEA
jgi:hypothetical protein